MWPFGRSAGRFMAPIAQNGPFWAQKCCFWARNQFFVNIFQFFCCHHDRAPKRQRFCVYHNAGQAPGGVQGPLFGQNWSQNLIFITLHPFNPPFLVPAKKCLDITKILPMVIYWFFKGPAAIESGQLSNDSRQTQEYKCVDDA